MPEEQTEGRLTEGTDGRTGKPSKDSWTAEYHPPQLVGFLACEDVVQSVRRDPDTGTPEHVYTMQRVNYTLRAAAWPALFRRVAFAHLWIGGDEDIPYQVVLRILDPDGGQIASSRAVVIGEPENVNPVVISAFFNLRLYGPGRYRVELLLDDEVAFTCPLTVTGPPFQAEEETIQETEEVPEEGSPSEEEPREAQPPEDGALEDEDVPVDPEKDE
jgi:hypothetical protein